MIPVIRIKNEIFFVKSSVYDDVAETLRFWRMNKFIKVYTLASGKAIGQRLFLANTISGNLNELIANCLDPSSFGKEDKKCFIAISLALRSDPDKLIYITDNVNRKLLMFFFFFFDFVIKLDRFCSSFVCRYESSKRS